MTEIKADELKDLSLKLDKQTHLKEQAVLHKTKRQNEDRDTFKQH